MDSGQTKTITVLATSDLHGHLHPTDYRSQGECDLGFGKLAALIREERRHSPELLLLDNGDLIQGSPLSSFAIKNKTGVHPAIAALNELGYDAAVPGNHEFNYGFGMLRNVMRDSAFPWLSAGITAQRSGEPAFGRPYLIKMIDGVKVAVLGLTTHYIPNWENPAHIQGLQFHDALETAKAWVPRIRKEEAPDVLVVSYHGGFEADLQTGAPSEKPTGENQAYAMCTEVAGIDVLVTGHQHRLLAGEVHGVTVVQSGCNGQTMGKISIDLVLEQGRWVIRGKRAELLKPDRHVKPDAAVLGLSQELEERTQAWLDEPIGHSEAGMTLASPLACRIEEHPFIEFTNRVQMESAAVSVSCTALLSEASKGFGETITRRDVLTNFMYPNTLTVLRLTGRDIRAALEQTACYFVMDAYGNPAVNPAYLEPKAQHYNYDMWEGIEYTLNIARPPGSRVTRLMYDGVELSDETELDVVMNSYRAGGGGDYAMFWGKPIIREILRDTAELVEEYITERGKIPAECNQNWIVVAEP
ncbi:2',3'-cyclic-nucleotide 2'-phosphodiesterase/3'-nucleotidase [Fontibacillus phaseoli]|uniref:2',3'-cyclic-nucleotide 2'-phosphodiesterase/3'-nucleotidase n=1 Tax=Fontibacillus phaseoli TaxID=1416533 RepID=A0A369BBE0_9BACL|nr:bifunctional UDP-sugar hydrolase/5'-nucleotidase [Fontibacillus phaseoli]RCX17807.1 2',3'-cyclic-nucleotide 2'-phosphodiesterase/3'-nucleotidase [Fontibacillus phaseoli]